MEDVICCTNHDSFNFEKGSRATLMKNVMGMEETLEHPSSVNAHLCILNYKWHVFIVPLRLWQKVFKSFKQLQFRQLALRCLKNEAGMS